MLENKRQIKLINQFSVLKRPCSRCSNNVCNDQILNLSNSQVVCHQNGQPGHRPQRVCPERAVWAIKRMTCNAHKLGTRRTCEYESAAGDLQRTGATWKASAYS